MTTAPSPETSTAPGPPPPHPGGAPRRRPRRGAHGHHRSGDRRGAPRRRLVQSAVYSRADGDLDWKYYGVGLGAAILLTIIAPLAVVFVADSAIRTAVAAWPAAFGALGVGLMVAIGMEDGDAVAWVVGGIVLGLSVVGYLLARGGARPSLRCSGSASSTPAGSTRSSPSTEMRPVSPRSARVFSCSWSE